MFKNTDEITARAKSNKNRLSFNSQTDSTPKGALILTYTNELVS